MSQQGADPDFRYARGEITRDEWRRLRGSAAGAPPALPRPPAPGGHRGVLVAAVIVIAGVAVAAAFLWSLAGSSIPGWNASYGAVQQLQAADFGPLNASATQGTAFASNDTVWFPAGSVDLVVYMSPPDHDMTFIVQGMVNPTIHVAAGSRVTLTAVNMDGDMYHNWALSRNGPPFGTMPMMNSGSMMSMTMLSHASGTGYWSQSMSFTAASGSYWYLCEYAGHAANGMYGSFVVG